MFDGNQPFVCVWSLCLCECNPVLTFRAKTLSFAFFVSLSFSSIPVWVTTPILSKPLMNSSPPWASKESPLFVFKQALTYTIDRYNSHFVQTTMLLRGPKRLDLVDILDSDSSKSVLCNPAHTRCQLGLAPAPWFDKQSRKLMDGCMAFMWRILTSQCQERLSIKWWNSLKKA